MSNIFKKVKTVTLLSSQTLEATEADTQAVTSRVVLETYESDQLNLVCKYIPGSSETNNNAYVKVWGYIGTYSEDNDFPYSSTVNSKIINDTANWIQIGENTNTGGVVDFTASSFRIAGATGGTTYYANFSFGITWPKIRISAYEEGVSSAKGRLSVVALIQ